MTLTGARAWTVGLCNSCIVVMAGRWIMFDNGAWDFKIDNDRIGRAVESSRIRGAEELKTCILAAYGLLGREVSAKMSYWLNDGESEMVGLVASPVELATGKDFRIFKALHRADKSVNLFQIEERYKRNSQSGGMVATSKDQDKSGETLDDGSGANSENCEQEKGNVCGDDLAVDNRENKEGKVEEGDAVKTASDYLPQQICLIEDTRTLSVEQVSVENGNNGGAHEDVAAEDEGDDSDYDYNGWHHYCRNDCVTEDDDDFVEGPGKGRSGGQSGGKGIRRPGGIGGTGAAKSACEVTETEVGVDVVLVTPPQSKNEHTRVTEDNDDDAVVDTPIPQPATFQGEEVLTKVGDNVSGTPTDVGCAPNQATEAVESGDICLETPPNQYNTHNRELEDEDDVDPHVTATRQYTMFVCKHHLKETWAETVRGTILQSPLDCGFFQWIDEEEPFGWQKQALIEARDEISEQKRTIMELKKTISHLQSDLGKNAEIEEDIINGFLNM
ncbi:hypothetical protein Bca4012_076183 [Brassica carinata]